MLTETKERIKTVTIIVLINAILLGSAYVYIKVQQYVYRMDKSHLEAQVAKLTTQNEQLQSNMNALQRNLNLK